MKKSKRVTTKAKLTDAEASKRAKAIFDFCLPDNKIQGALCKTVHQ